MPKPASTRQHAKADMLMCATSSRAMCLVTSVSQGSWSLGSGKYGDSIQLYVQNTGSKAIPVPWTLAIGDHYTGVSGVRVQGCRLSLVCAQLSGLL